MNRNMVLGVMAISGIVLLVSAAAVSLCPIWCTILLIKPELANPLVKAATDRITRTMFKSMMSGNQPNITKRTKLP